MKRLIVGFCLMASPSAAEVFSGNELHRFCQEDRAAMYVAGVLDKADQDSTFIYFITPGEASSARTATIQKLQSSIRNYCLPPKSTLGQVSDVVCKYIKENPKERDKTGAAMILFALGEAFPCPK